MPIRLPIRTKNRGVFLLSVKRRAQLGIALEAVKIGQKNPEKRMTMIQRSQQFPLIALQPLPLMSMGQFGHPCWLDARQTVINIGDMSVSKQGHFMLWASPTRDDWQSPR